MAPVRQAIERLLSGHEPYPALVVDRGRRVVAANRGLGLLAAGVASHLLDAPVNALRLALAPDGMAPRIAGYPLHRDSHAERLRGLRAHRKGAWCGSRRQAA
ncbi:MAG: hypothetical protein ACRDRO_06695 [Pseudonocardiaceae bacterium]